MRDYFKFSKTFSIQIKHFHACSAYFEIFSLLLCLINYLDHEKKAQLFS